MSPPTAGDPVPPPLPMTQVSKGKFALILLGMAVRLLVGFFFILLLLNLVPKKPGDPVIYPVVMCILGIAVYAWFFQRQVRSVYKSRYPTLRAIEALILVAAMFLAIFTMVYVILSINDPSSFTEQLDSFTGYYFSLTVLATVGFGDITPVTTTARSFTMVQMALDIAFLAVVIKVMTGAARKALEQRALERQKTQPTSAQAPQQPGPQQEVSS